MIRVYDKNYIQTIGETDSLFPIIDVAYDFREDVDNVYVYITIKYSGDYTHSFDVSINKKLYSDMILTVSLLGRDAYDRFKSIVFDPKYHQVYGFYSRGTDFNLFNTASIWISSDTGVVTIVPHIKTNNNLSNIDTLTYTTINFVDEDPQSTLVSLVPEAAAAKNKWFFKKKYIQNLLDPYESIAYLEGQVDVLAKVINMLIDKTGLDVGEYKEVLKYMDDNSVIDVKTLDKIKTEILEDKAKVRDIQRAYYIAKNGQ